jgi:hypothetical protein
MIRFRKAVVCMAALLMLGIASASTAAAQRYLGGIQGEITDPSGAKVSGASVTAVEVSTHYKSEATTNDAGSYNFPALNPGSYTITVAAKGFQPKTTTDIVLTAGQLQNMDFKLTVGGGVETVQVTAENTLIDTGSANIATTLSNQEVTDLPNNGRNPYVMATLAAGVINTGSGGYFQGKSSQFTNPFSGVAVQVTTDGNSGHNRLTLDGIPNDSAERLSGSSYTNFVPSPEAVQEVKAQTSIFDAQIGHGNGTVTNTVVRSGNNALHGSAYYVFQNTYLNANTSEKALSNAVRNNDQLSQTGFVLDGPVYIPKIYNGRDKTFFMVAFERYASHSAVNYNSHVPTQQERSGDFSDLCNAFNSSGLCTSGFQIYDPQSPIDSFGNRTQFFANNKIPTGRQPGAALLTYYPLPNVAGASANGGTNYVATQTSYDSTYPSIIVRIDQEIGLKNKISAILFRSGLTQQGPHEGFPKEIGPGDCGVCFYHVYRNNRGGSLDDVHQFSSSMVLDSRLGVLWHPFGLVYPDAQGYELSGLGISSAGLPYTSFPGISPSGYAQLPNAARGQVSTNMTGALEEVLSKSIRTHTVRFGFEGNLIHYNVQNPQSGFGSFNFDSRFTQQNWQTGDPNSGNAMAAVVLGAFSSTSFNISPAYALSQIYTAPFVQDDWRATPKLTLNLGFRWDYESPFTERYNKQVSGFCTTCTNPLQSSVTGLALKGGLQYTSNSNRYPYKKDWNNFQPRIGFAYQWFPKTVVRGGYGVIYFNTLESPNGTGYSQTTSYNNFTGTNSNTAPLNPLTAPFPGGVLLPTGSSAGLGTAIGGGFNFLDPNHVQPKSTQYTASVQQQLPGFALQIAYVGARPSRLEVNHNIDALPTQYWNQGGTGVNFLNAQVPNPMVGLIPTNSNLNKPTIQQLQLLLPFPEFTSVTELGSSWGSDPYNALQIQVSHPMRHHVSFQANLTWDKVMRHDFYYDDYWAGIGKLASQEDSNPTIFANVFGTVELPKLMAQPYFTRLALGGWKLNSVVRFSNGPLVGQPGNTVVIGNYIQPHQTYDREFNTCYLQASAPNSTTGVITYNQIFTGPPGAIPPKIRACDAQSSTPAFRTRYQNESQQGPGVLQIREPLKPLMDLSVFKQFILREGVSFEIRGEFFNVMNTPNYGGPSTGLGGATTGSVLSYSSAYPNGFFTQANDARIGELTARINF